MKRFEDKLTENITAAFNAYQEPVDAAAFQDIQSRLRKRRRRVFWYPWLYRGMAASVLLGTAVVMWSQLQTTSHEESNPTDQTMAIFGQDDIVSNNKEASISTESYAQVDHLNEAPSAEPMYEKPLSPALSGSRHKEDKISRNAAGIKNSGELQTPTSDKIPMDMPNKPSLQILERSTSDGVNTHHYQVVQPLPTYMEQVHSIQKDRPTSNFFPSWPIFNGSGKESKVESRFSMVAGIQAGLIKSQIAQGVGLKMGGMYHLPLRKGVGLTTGLLVSHVRLNYDPTLSTPVSFNLAEDDLQVDFHPPFEVETDNQVDARLWSFEIPLLLSYSWRQSGGGVYRLHAGFSSMWYVQQRFFIDRTVYTAEVTIDNISTQQVTITDTRQERIEERYPAFQRFDPLALFNISFAFPIKMGTRHVYLEPFVQLPVGTQTSRSIAYGSGGFYLNIPFYHTQLTHK